MKTTRGNKEQRLRNAGVRTFIPHCDGEDRRLCKEAGTCLKWKRDGMHRLAQRVFERGCLVIEARKDAKR
jgi:hypothetical protein